MCVMDTSALSEFNKSTHFLFFLCSEIRLVEIIENLCDSSNFECNNMVEEHEEHIEIWWFKR